MSRANSLRWHLAPAKRFFLFASLCVPVFTASADISKNLVAHYALDDGTGMVAQDSSGGKNHGTLQGYESGPIGWTTGAVGGALSFDGNDDFVSVPHDNALNLITYTVAAWVKVAPGDEIRPIVVKGKFDDGVASTDVPYGIYLSPAKKLSLAYEKASSSQRLAENMSYEATGDGLNPGEIHHVAVTRINSGGLVAFYVDGQSRGTFESTPKPGDNKKKLYIGVDPKTNKLFKGGLDDVRIYSRALDSSEILALSSGKGTQTENGSGKEQETKTQNNASKADGDEEGQGAKADGSSGKGQQAEDGPVEEPETEIQDDAEEQDDEEGQGAKGNDSSGKGQQAENGPAEEPETETQDDAEEHILLSANIVRESQKAGTVVGRLVVIDPDDPKSKGNYKLELVSTDNTRTRRAGKDTRETEKTTATSRDEKPSDSTKQSEGTSKNSETKKGDDKNDASVVKTASNTSKAASADGEKEKDIGKAVDSTEQTTAALEKSESKQTIAKTDPSTINSHANSSKSEPESKAEPESKEKEREQPDDRANESKQTSATTKTSSAASDDVPFSIDSTGRLLTARVLDYETCESYPIRIRATDESGKSVEIDFVIQVKNAFVPIVQTGGVSKKKARRVMVNGKVLVDGYSSIEEVGVVVSKHPRFARGDKRATVTSAEKVSEIFELSLLGLEPETTYYFRAYALNGEGTSYGALKNFTTPKSDDGPWANSESVGNGWLRSDWMGNVYQAENGWIYHQELGWLFPEKDDSTGVWLYSKDFLGWFWTGPEIFPFVYVDRSSSWAYYQGILADHRAFFHFGRSSWMTFPKSGSTKQKNSNKAADGKSAEKQSTAKDSAARQASEGKVLETTAKQKR